VFSAQLDTCVLVPSYLRDVLLQIAEHGVYRGLWSSEILAELHRTVHARLVVRGNDEQTAAAYVERLLRQMETAFPDALVENWEPLLPTIHIPDPNDRHVVAAAVVGRADVIVTENRKDFPAAELPTPLYVQSADVFLLDSLDLYPTAVLEAVRVVAARTGRTGPILNPGEVLAGIREAPEFAARATPMLH
jgi:predicted nucleic acid-binding protein